MRILLPLFFLLTGLHAFADQRSEVLSLERELEERINPILRAYDPTAFGIVKIEAKQASGNVLPGTPLQVQDMLVRSPDGAFAIEKLQINIIGNDVDALRESIPAIKLLAARLDTPPVIRIDEKKVPHKVEEKNAIKHATTLEVVANDLSSLLREGLGVLRNALWAFLGAFLLFCIVYLSGIGAMTSKVSRTLEKGLKSLSDGAEGRNFREDRVAALRTTTPAQPRVVETLSPRLMPISEFSEESLLACLTDCYWGEYDGYAAFLWKQIPVAKRTSLLLHAPFLVEYTSFISDIPAVDIGAIDSPAYLKPLPITHLDNKAITEHVKKKPALAGNLSPLRLKSLQLSLNERVRLRENMQRGISGVVENFTQTPMSVPRKIRRKFKIEVNSIAEDRELIGMAEPALDLIDEICSLSWLTYLPQEDLKSITEGFSARDLAEAWMGPEEVLDALARSLPAKKLELLRSVQTKVQPSRDSVAFKTIHSAIAKQLRTRSSRAPEGAGRGNVAHDRQKRAA